MRELSFDEVEALGYDGTLRSNGGRYYLEVEAVELQKDDIINGCAGKTDAGPLREVTIDRHVGKTVSVSHPTASCGRNWHWLRWDDKFIIERFKADA